MIQSSNGAGTQEWLEATKGMTISAFIEPKGFRSIIENNGESFSKVDFEKALKKVSRKVKK